MHLPNTPKKLKETSDTDKISIEHLEQQPWIQFRFKQTGRVMPISIPYKGGIHKFSPNTGLVLDDGEALAYLCSDHLGLTQVPHFIAKPWIKSRGFNFFTAGLPTRWSWRFYYVFRKESVANKKSCIYRLYITRNGSDG